MKSFTTTIQKFILTVFCLFLFTNVHSQLMVEFRGDDMAAPTMCGSGIILEVMDQGCAPEDLGTYVKYGCEMKDALKGKNLEFGWYGVPGAAESWYYIGDPFMMWATAFHSPNTDCGGGGPPKKSYNCSGGTCSDPGDGSGIYQTLIDCQSNCSASPSLTVSAALVKNINACYGSAGTTNQSFTVSGSNLTGNISISESSNYIEISENGSSWVNAINLTPSSGTVNTTTIYVRARSGVVAGFFSSQNITISTSGASSETVGCSGEIYSTPTISSGLSDQSINDGDALSFNVTTTGCSNSTLDNEDIGSGNYSNSRITITETPGGFWQNVSGDDDSWYGESNKTGSGSTGPDGPNSGDDYIYIEASSGYAYSSGDIVYLESDAITQSGVKISFYYHMYGSDIGTLEVESYDGSSWTSRWSISGQQHTSESDAWTQGSADLSSYTVTKLRFKYTADGGYKGDAALDDILVEYGGCTYAWTGPNSYSATTEDVTVTNSASSSHQGTYNFTATNTNGCKVTGSSAVTVVCPTPSVSITGTDNSGTTNNDGSVCSGDAVTMDAGSHTSYSWSSGETSQTISKTSGGSYAVTVTNSCGSNASTSYTVTEHSLPSVDAGNDKSVCDGASTTLNGSGASSYSWDNSVTDGVAFTPSTTKTYTVTGTDGNNCTATDQIVVTVNSLPTPTITFTESSGASSNDGITCSGAAVSLDAGSYSSYLWDNSLGTSQTASPSPTSTTTYNVTVTDANGCKGSDGQEITVNDNPSISGLSDQTLNDGDNLSFSITTTNCGSSGTESGTSASGSSTANPRTVTKTITGLNTNPSGNATLTVYLKGDIDGASETVDVYDENGVWLFETANEGGESQCDASWDGQSHTISLATLTPLVADGSLTFTATGNSSVGYCDFYAYFEISYPYSEVCTYSWTGPSSFTSSDEDPTVTASASSSHAGSYTVDVTNPNSCTASASATISISCPTPSVSISATDNSGTSNNDGTVCSGDAVTMDAGSHTSYSWSSGETSQTISKTSGATYTVTVTNSCGSTNTASYTVTENNNPTAGITNNTGSTILTCSTTDISLTATGGSSYSWDNSLGSNADQTISSSGTYSVTVTDGNNCSANTSITLTSNTTAPTASITNNSGTTELTCSQTSISLTGNGGNTFSWSGGSNPGWKTNTFTSPGTYTMTTTSSSNGCSDSESITITQDISTPTASITNNDGTTELTCSQTAISVTATGGGTYSWDNSLGSNASQSLTSDGTYNVTVTASNGCTDNTSITLTSNTTAPSAGITNNSGTIELTCSQTSISLTATGGGSYIWSNSLGTNATVSITSPGTYSVKVTGSNGCTDQEDITITQDISTPTASITNNDGTTELTCSQTSISVTASGGSSYSWDNSLGSNSSQSLTSPGTYNVTVTGSNGCTDNTSITLTEDISTPTASITNNTGVTELTCSQTSISLTASGGSSYSWDNSLGSNASATVTSPNTYTVTATGSNGCTDTESITISQDVSTPTASITNNDGTTELTCSQTSISLTASGGSSYSWSNGGSSASTSPTSDGTYTVTVTSSNGCTDTESITLTSNTTVPTVTANTTSSAVCDGSSVTLTGGGASTYSWDNSVSDGVSFTPSSTTTYTVTGTASNGCTNTASTTVTVNANPTASISGDNSACGTGVTWDGSGSSAGSGTISSYSWEVSGFQMGSNSTYNVSLTGPYDLVVTNSNGCTNTTSKTFTRHSNPTAAITNNDGTSELTCSQTSISLTASGGSSYSWSGSLGSSANASATAAGTYTVTVTDGNGCTDTESIVITQDISTPTAGITNNDGTSELTCSQTAISVTATGGSSYSWDNSLGTNASQSLTSDGTYNVTVTGSNGCTDNTSITITSNTTAPSASITNNDGTSELTCSQTSISLTAGGGVSYVWSNSLGTNTNVSITSPGSYSVKVTGSNGCTDIESITITQDISTPTVGITNNSGVTELTCSQTSISLTATGGSSYSWDNSLGSNANATATSPNTYTVTATGSNGCTDTESITLTQDISTPTAGITNNDGTTELTCSQTSISLTATGGSSYSWSNSASTASTSPTSAGTYTVTVTGSNGCTDNTSVTLTSNTTAPSAGITNNTGSSTITCTTTSISVSATGGGTYSWDNSLGTSANQTLSSAGTYSVTVTGSNGCTDNTSITISTNTTAPTVTASSSAGSVCDGTSVTLTGGGANTYSWDNSVSDGVAFTPSTTTTYTVTGTNTTNGCTNTATTTVTVNNNPSPTISVTETSGGSNNDGILCSGDAATLDAGSYSSYSWSTGETSQTISKSTTATYTVTVTDGNGCTGSDNQTITSNANPLVSPSASPASISSGNSSNLLANASGGSSPYSYSWDNGGSLNSTTTSNPVATPTTTTTYSVTVSDNNSCEVSGSVTVSVATGTITWVGGTSTDWNTASNWDVGGVPSSSNDVVIPSGTANMCYTPTNGNVFANSLTVNSGATLVVRNTSASNTKLTVSDDMTINGSLTQTGDADILLSGVAKTLTVGGGAVTTSGRLSISGSYSLSGNIIATNIEVQTGGSFTVNANDVRTYNFTQDGTYTMTTGNLYIEGSTASFTDATFVEGTGHVYIGNNTGTTYYSSGPTSVTVTSGVDFYHLTLNTNFGVDVTMGTGIGSYSVGGNINLLNPGSAGGEIITKDAIHVGGNLNIQTSGYSLVAKLYDRIYRTVGTGTFTMGSSADNSICVYYSSSVNEVISGFGSNLSYGGTTCLAAPGAVVLTATDFDNLTLSEAATTVTLPNDINVTGNLTIGAGELNGGSANINLTGNFNVVGGTFTKGTSTVKMIGSSAQTITTNGSSLYNLEITNTKASGASVTLGDDLTVSNTLTLGDGILETTSNYTVFVDDSRVNAIVGDDGTTNTLNASSFVWGKLKRSIINGGASGNNTYIFPVGQQFNGAVQPKYYRSDVIANNMVTTSNITVGYTEGAHAAYTSETDFMNQTIAVVVPSGSTGFTMKRMLTEGYWTVTPNTQPTGGNYDIVFHHNVYEVLGSSGKVGIVKCPEGSNSITDWVAAGTLAGDNSGFRTTSDGKLKVTGLTSFSDFGLGDGGGAALPIELLNFDVALNGGKAILTWTTATEINNDFFTVERTLDGMNYEEVLEMPGSGNSFSPITYVAYDENPLPGTSYYRLKQTDYDGSYDYSAMVEIYNPYISNISDFVVTVNEEDIVVKYILGESTDFDIIIYDIMGRVVSHKLADNKVGKNKMIISARSYESGAYFVVLQNKADIHSEKIIIRR